MNKRNLVLLSTAAGVALGGAGWLLNRWLTAPRNVSPVGIGDHFPSMTGLLLTGKPLTIPDGLRGDVGLLLLDWDNTAPHETMLWARELWPIYGTVPGMQVLTVALFDGIGPVLRGVIDRFINRQTPTPEREHVMVVAGDLRRLRGQLDTAVTARPTPSVVLLGRTGRLAWRYDGAPTPEALASLREALAAHGIVEESPPES